MTATHKQRLLLTAFEQRAHKAGLTFENHPHTHNSGATSFTDGECVRLSMRYEFQDDRFKLHLRGDAVEALDLDQYEGPRAARTDGIKYAVPYSDETTQASLLTLVDDALVAA